MSKTLPDFGQSQDERESIHDLPGDEYPLIMSDSLDLQAIPLLSDIVHSETLPEEQSQTLSPAAIPEIEPRDKPSEPTVIQKSSETIIQGILDQLLPKIEAELKQCLEQHFDELIKARNKP
ncbi:hypothetical protein [Azomonas macrocytogenes]|uniref:Uncharacterized protein n=1 Tax=Azomonas macrocytogenes TaxID=69962 RepID=A0A839T070_AZOMA|nr:hypothetical protein [Azomonas macrocytogenes]MBB3101920.1 hypothetical protein [Azomonas macrocytogenes]